MLGQGKDIIPWASPLRYYLKELEVSGKIHLLGHRSRSFTGLSLASCAQGSSARLTEDVRLATCFLCLRMLARVTELDPITRNHGTTHKSCVGRKDGAH